MKVIYKFLFAFIVLSIFWSCAKEETIDVDPSFVLSFQRDGKTDALADSTFYVLPTGSGEFVTLYNGTAGHVWGEAGATGTFFDKSDSLGVVYNTAGKYNLTVVATSSSDFGKSSVREVKTVEINVIDKRNVITNFFTADYTGSIVNDSIHFFVPDIVTDFNFKPTFILTSPLAKVYVNGVEQESGVTVNDFSHPVVYTVKSAEGTEKNYIVKFSTYTASDEKKITKFGLAEYNTITKYYNSNGERGVIDEVNKTISVPVNYGTKTKAKLVIESSYLSTVLLNGGGFDSNTNYKLSTLKTVTVTAQNKSQVTYSINLIDQAPVLNFTFDGLVPAPIGIIDNVAKTISVDVLNGTDLKNLVAKWTGTVGTVKIGSNVQINGVTANDFTSPVKYIFYKGDVLGDTYTVTVNVK